ncbi:Protein lin-10 [Trichinella nelsoni]|uniref:Protein lin-10 n=1 Tax=Trichinella nelsoni TaxID=6336 RepID=A0A0V0S920_9BILA|nr:Protein lin-10 [Trichinella nelsoni]
MAEMDACECRASSSPESSETTPTLMAPVNDHHLTLHLPQGFSTTTNGSAETTAVTGEQYSYPQFNEEDLLTYFNRLKMYCDAAATPTQSKATSPRRRLQPVFGHESLAYDATSPIQPELIDCHFANQLSNIYKCEQRRSSRSALAEIPQHMPEVSTENVSHRCQSLPSLDEANSVKEEVSKESNSDKLPEDKGRPLNVSADLIDRKMEELQQQLTSITKTNASLVASKINWSSRKCSNYAAFAAESQNQKGRTLNELAASSSEEELKINKKVESYMDNTTRHVDHQLSGGLKCPTFSVGVPAVTVPPLHLLPLAPAKNSLELAKQLEEYAALLRASSADVKPLHNNGAPVERLSLVSAAEQVPSDCHCENHVSDTVEQSDISEFSTVNSEDHVWVLRSSFRRRQNLERQQKECKEALHRSQSSPTIPKHILEENDDTEGETDQLLKVQNNDGKSSVPAPCNQKKTKKKKETLLYYVVNALRIDLYSVLITMIVHEPAVLIEGVLFRARYLGSTQIVSEGPTTKASRMLQAQEAVSCIKAPDGESQPATDVDLFISTEKIMVLNTDMQGMINEKRFFKLTVLCYIVTNLMMIVILEGVRDRRASGYYDGSRLADNQVLRNTENYYYFDFYFSYIADIGDLVVLMARRVSHSSTSTASHGILAVPKMICHVFESEEAQFIAQSIGQAFQVAYMEFLRSRGIDDPNYVKELDYQQVLNSQEIYCDELEMFSNRETQKDIVIPKRKDEPLGVAVVESGWGSMLPTVVIANMLPEGAAARCKKINIGDHIIALNGISFVGLPLNICQNHIKDARSLTAVKITIVQTPPVVEVRIKRPDTKYQLGFSVQNGVICSLLRGGIAERGGIRVGHRIIEINGQSAVAVPHEKVVTMLATAVGEVLATMIYYVYTYENNANIYVSNVNWSGDAALFVKISWKYCLFEESALQ